MLMGVAALLSASCDGCNHNGGRDGGGGGGAPDMSVGPDLAVQPGACNTDPDCGDPAQICCDKICVETASCALSVTSLTAPNGFQNGGEYVTLHGNGFAAGMKVFIEKGRAPVHVIDAQSARIQTPPGPVGMQDVRIEVGGASATLHKGFAYRSAGLETKWEQKPLQVVRGEDPGIAVMQDGRVLVAGGTTVPDQQGDALPTAEIYTRSSDSVAPAANMMSTPRWQNSAVTLLTGKVLVVGGACAVGAATCNGDTQAADLFDPATNTFTPTANKLNKPRYYTHSVLMVDGRVFISSANDPDVEIYDPATDAFSLVTHTPLHQYGYVVRLRDGRVLLFGGDGGNQAAELFDSDTNTFTATGNMVQGRSMLTAHTLPDGRVLAIAGASSSAGGIIDPLKSVDLYDPVNGSWTNAPFALNTGRCWHASALVRDGTLLVMGGYTTHASCDSSVAKVETIDPVAGTVTSFADLPNTNTEWTAVTLLDGSVLGVGGGACGTTMALPDIDFLAGAPIP
jgi:IPT/TIG domain-containing protein